jgi:hypothetical protein
VPRAFSDAIDRAIAKDRSDRQATAGDLAVQLRAGLGETGGQSPSVRSLPGTPQAEDSPAHTQESRGSLTKSDVNAATIVTVDAVPTTPPRSPVPVKPPPTASSGAASYEQGQAPQAAAADDLTSIITRVQAPKPQVTPEKSRGKSLVFVGAGVLILVLIVVGVGGVLVFNWLKTKPDDSSAGAGGKGKTGTNGSDGPSAAPATAVGRYWLEVLPNPLATEPQRVAGAVPLASGQSFKFHFEFGGSGYLYIIGPGERNQPTAFLTDKPAAISGVESNEVAKGSDFSFPNGIEHWLELDKKPGTEDYTIVLSPERLSAPAFFSSQATGKPLSETEQAELKDFLAKNKTSAPVTEVDEKAAAAPFVTVKVPQSGSSSGPVVFAVRIEHK